MSFFGFDTTLPRDQGHPNRGPGFTHPQDPFASLSKGGGLEDEAIDFEDTYDGLGDQLDDADDALNDDTFGGGPATQQSVGRDFDFAGNTSKISNTLQEEQMLFEARARHRPAARQPVKPARTGYESYKDPNYIPQLEVRADIWGIQPKGPAHNQQPEQRQAQPTQAPARKMLSVEEVEAMMRAQASSHASAPPQMQPVHNQPPPHMPVQHPHQLPPQPLPYRGMPGQQGVQILQRPQHQGVQPVPAPQQHGFHAELPGHPAHTQAPQQPSAVPRPVPEVQAQPQRAVPPHLAAQGPPPHPRQISPSPHRLAGPGQPMAQSGVSQRGSAPGDSRGTSFQGMVITHPDQLLQLSEEQRAAFLEEDAKRAKRNHKIALLAKDNGLMTPQDKNFITRIQLQQLMSATGNVEDAGPDAALAEDFYYHVFSQIRGAHRQTPNQPANQFAQTYLFQTNSRYGGRRNARGGDNHIQRMEQQVQRAVEAAKAKPKAKQLVVEGSLGKISFSNSKTPRPLLHIKRQTTDKHGKQHKPSVADRKEVLRNIEAAYISLMRMEDHMRVEPPPPNQESSPEAIQQHMEWRSKLDALHDQLWQDVKIMEPLNLQSSTPHPFIAMLSHPKGKKLIPRLFHLITEEERLTVVTMIVYHLDRLPVVAHAVGVPDEPVSPAIRQEVDLFSHTVIGPVFTHLQESPLDVIVGLLGLICDRTNLFVVARSEIGIKLLSMLVARAELIKGSTPEMKPGLWESWMELYNRLFDAVEPVLPYLFPASVNEQNDHHVWGFLAAMGAGASPEQQQRLVIGVKDRVMDTVALSKTLPAEMAATRLANVNLFMRAIGLDVDLLG
ncbi:hypothetical protein M011DRAFT_396961 [Sporormia fimetaria CBS 119925]|uniref:mRNA decay factor PAT1 domain-containing protein n=1 Tax=Sporormia fimetaria CBS 119925 TaxID=1340428 RepID=A0A6A6VML0_9PLEO|nr:hypothetical protein M011DRAFT_396961 [Sporormia fimetaria CBS 119925]